MAALSLIVALPCQLAEVPERAGVLAGALLGDPKSLGAQGFNSPSLRYATSIDHQTASPELQSKSA